MLWSGGLAPGFDAPDAHWPLVRLRVFPHYGVPCSTLLLPLREKVAAKPTDEGLGDSHAPHPDPLPRRAGGGSLRRQIRDDRIEQRRALGRHAQSPRRVFGDE